MDNVLFTVATWDQYIDWQAQDKKTLKRINLLIKDMQRNPFSGIGKSEPLKENLTGFWSRRIDDTHRIVYSFDQGTINIISCWGHY